MNLDNLISLEAAEELYYVAQHLKPSQSGLVSVGKETGKGRSKYLVTTHSLTPFFS